jgi:hypothetical protein
MPVQIPSRRLRDRQSHGPGVLVRTDRHVRAVASGADLDYEGLSVRLIRPEYLIALYLEPGARTHKRLEPVAALLEEGSVDRELMDRVLARYNLSLPRYE